MYNILWWDRMITYPTISPVTGIHFCFHFIGPMKDTDKKHIVLNSFTNHVFFQPMLKCGFFYEVLAISWLSPFKYKDQVVFELRKFFSISLIFYCHFPFFVCWVSTIFLGFLLYHLRISLGLFLCLNFFVTNLISTKSSFPLQFLYWHF